MLRTGLRVLPGSVAHDRAEWQVKEISTVSEAPIDLQSPLTARQQDLVRDTFTLLAPSATDVVALLYARLFEVAPKLRPLFHADVRAQGDKLIQALALAVSHLDDLESIAPGVRALGKRHQQYGERHYLHHRGSPVVLKNVRAGTEATLAARKAQPGIIA